MAQILDLSKKYSKEQLEASANISSFNSPPAGGYICEIKDVVLNNDDIAGKANIELNVDISEGEYSGYFQSLADRFGFWGLRGFMSFKEEALPWFRRNCIALCNSNPGLVFNPFAPGGVDIDILKGKKVGVVIQKEEYKSTNGDIKERDRVASFTEIENIRNKKYKVPDLKKLKVEYDISVPQNGPDEVPY